MKTLIALMVGLLVMVGGRKCALANCNDATCWAGSGTGGTFYGGVGASGTGVLGLGVGANYAGVFGENGSTNGVGVEGKLNPYGEGIAVYGDNKSGAYGAWAGGFDGSVYVANALWIGGSCQFNCPSDARLKKNVVALPPGVALGTLLALRPVTYEWLDEAARGAGSQVGFIAQDVETVNARWVRTDADGQKYLNVVWPEFGAYLVGSVQSLQQQNDSLREHVRDLDATLARQGLLLALSGGGGAVVLVVLLRRRAAR